MPRNHLNALVWSNLRRDSNAKPFWHANRLQLFDIFLCCSCCCLMPACSTPPFARERERESLCWKVRERLFALRTWRLATGCRVTTAARNQNKTFQICTAEELFSFLSHSLSFNFPEPEVKSAKVVKIFEALSGKKFFATRAKNKTSD